jgi:hypothetical protein
MRYGQHTQVAPPRYAQWGVHWKLPSLMIGSYGLAVLIALGHHLLYKSLHGQQVVNQEVNLAFVALSR